MKHPFNIIREDGYPLPSLQNAVQKSPILIGSSPYQTSCLRHSPLTLVSNKSLASCSVECLLNQLFREVLLQIGLQAELPSSVLSKYFYFIFIILLSISFYSLLILFYYLLKKLDILITVHERFHYQIKISLHYLFYFTC